MTRRTVLAGAGGALATFGIAARAETGGGAPRRSFTPGKPWLDTSGRPIQAHGGSVLFVDGTYYWYGENKEFTTGASKVWTSGVRCYSSDDLYNWRDLGLIIPPNEDPASPLNPTTALLDRPHILFNHRTRKFVCWLKIMRGPEQTRTVLTADRINGPYSIVRQGLHPLGMNAGDFDLCASPDDGKAYMYFERVHTEMICADLTDDYTDLTGYYSTHLPRGRPPFVREGPAYFRRGAKHYLATSGTTGYFPNPSEIAVADTFHGPFTTLGDLHPKDPSHTSFDSQISAVFKHPAKRDLYIALADRWTAALPEATFDAAKGAFAKLRETNHPPLTPAESAGMRASAMHGLDTSAARYVWLPIQFDGDRPFIDWRAEWRWEDYA